MNRFDKKTAQKSIFWFPSCHQTANVFHLISVGFYEFFTTMPRPRYYIFQIAYKKHLFKPISPNIHPERISTQLLKTALAKCSTTLHCLCACCSAYQTDKLSRSPRYLAWTAHASISSSASISLSVIACLFIQLELFESLELPWCVSVPAGRDLCVQSLPFSKFWLILCPSMVPKCCANCAIRYVPAYSRKT